VKPAMLSSVGSLVEGGEPQDEDRGSFTLIPNKDLIFFFSLTQQCCLKAKQNESAGLVSMEEKYFLKGTF
jgi:hypothetical protein